MRRLIVCCDGTWNKPGSADSEDVRQPDTNVVRLMRLIAPVTKVRGEVVSQIVFYQRGVGTAKDWLDRLLGGLFGFGVSDRIRTAYGFLVDNYCEGDEIYLFGFSRGAFTARRLAGMISTVGLLEKRNMQYFKRVWNAFKSWSPTEGPIPDENLKEIFAPHPRRPWRSRGESAAALDGSPTRRPAIRFVGVWDTVGAYGIPGLQQFFGKLRANYVGFADRTIPARVLYARQALARHEHRKFFVPNLWDNDSERIGDRPRLKQVWFDGAHSNVGGGYWDDPLPYLALTWMMDEAAAAGLVFERVPDAVRQEIERLDSYAHATIKNSYWEFRRKFLAWVVGLTLVALFNTAFPGLVPSLIAGSVHIVSLNPLTAALQPYGQLPAGIRLLTQHPWITLLWLAWFVSFFFESRRESSFRKPDTLVHWSALDRAGITDIDRQREEKKTELARSCYPDTAPADVIHV